MRRKPVPPAPDDIDRLRAVRAAVPIVPRGEESCCVRLVDRADVPAEDEARTWLTFLTALHLARETDDGSFVRVRDPEAPSREWIADRFCEGVYGARELLAALPASGGEPGSLSAGAAFDRFREAGHVPRWEQDRDRDWKSTWRDRVGRLLDWAVLLGLADRVDGGYVRVADAG